MKALKVIKFMPEEKAQTIREWLDCTRDEHWEPTTVAVYTEKGIATENNSVRKGARLLDSAIPVPLKDDLYATLYSGLAQYKEEMETSYPAFKQIGGCPGTKPGNYLEYLQILRYFPSDFYSWHSDTYVVDGWQEENSFYMTERKLSIVLYLNNDFEEGQTEFTSGRLMKPKPGEGLVFPATEFYPHRARTVTSGMKYALVTWVCGQGTPIPNMHIRR